MTQQQRFDADTLGAALRRQAVKVNRLSASSWRFELRNGKPRAVRATMSDEWLRLTTPVGHEPAADLGWQLLALNGQLPPSAKVTINRRDGSPHVCVDTCLSAQDDITHRLSAACSSLLEAATRVASFEGDPPFPPFPSFDQKLNDGMAEQSRDLLSEAQWPWTERADQIRVDLESRGSHAQVVLAQCDDALRVGLELVAATGLTLTCRTALSVFLLTGTRALRLVRARIAQLDERQSVGLEVVLTAPLRAGDLDTALSGLATAYDLLGAEALALRHDWLAQQYLSTSGLARVRRTCESEPDQETTDQPEPILQEG